MTTKTAALIMIHLTAIIVVFFSTWCASKRSLGDVWEFMRTPVAPQVVDVAHEDKEATFIDYPLITDKMREAAKVLGSSDEKIMAAIRQGWSETHHYYVVGEQDNHVVEFESKKVWRSEEYWDAAAVMMKEIIKVLKKKEEERE